MKTALDRRWPAWRAHALVPLLPVMALPLPVLAQSSYGRPYVDPYKSGPTRPLDGSPRNGVYSAAPAPRFDTPMRSGYAVSPADERPPIWRGTYAGIQGGYRWTGTEAPGAGLAKLDLRSLQFGAHLGHNFQTGNVVYGLEGDLMFGTASATASAGGLSLSQRDTWTSTLRARAGYAFGPALLYATGGVAVAGQDLTLKSSTLTTTLSDARVGYAIGGGLEMQLTQALSARIEGLHYGYKDVTLTSGTLGQAVKQDSNVVRAGISYRFN